MLLNHVGKPSDQSKEAEKCVICREALDNDVSNLSSCSHKFHKDCIENWAKITNQCPICRERFQYIQSGRLKQIVKEKNQKINDDTTEQYLQDLAEQPCEMCGSTDFDEMCLICDECDKCYHTHCIGLDDIPDDDLWYCPVCNPNSNSNNNDSNWLKKLNQRTREQRMRRRNRHRYNMNNNNNKYDLNSTLISKNEDNPSWLNTQDDEWRPNDYNWDNDNDDSDEWDNDNDNDSDYELSRSYDDKTYQSENDENNIKKQLKKISGYDFIGTNSKNDNNNNNNNNNNRRRNRKRKRNAIEDDADNNTNNNIFRTNKRRKTTCNSKMQINNNNNSWNCVHCTFLNESSALLCGVCEAKRGIKTIKQKANKNNKNNKNDEAMKHLSHNEYFTNNNSSKYKFLNKNRNRNKNKKESLSQPISKQKKKQKYSKSNPYIRQSPPSSKTSSSFASGRYAPFPDHNNNNKNRKIRTIADLKRKQNGKSVRSIIGDDILSYISAADSDNDNDDDWLSAASITSKIEKKSNNNKKHNKDVIQQTNSFVLDDMEFEKKPKMRFKHKFNKFCSQKTSS